MAQIIHIKKKTVSDLVLASSSLSGSSSGDCLLVDAMSAVGHCFPSGVECLLFRVSTICCVHYSIHFDVVVESLVPGAVCGDCLVVRLCVLCVVL